MRNAYFKNIAKSYQNSGSPKIKTFKNDPEYFNSQTFDKWTIKQLRTGKYGIDPETGALYKLKTPVKVPQEFLDLTSENPSDTETARRGAAFSGLRTAYQNPVMQAPGIIGLTAILGAGAGAALRAAAPRALQLLNAPMQVGSKVFPAVTPANLMTAAGVASAPENIASGVSNIRQGNYAQGAADIGTAALDVYVPEVLNAAKPLTNAAKKLAGTASKYTKSTDKTFSQNLKDLEYAKKWAKKYGYELPKDLKRIAESDALTDRTIRGLVNRHNTFVRGVSTNWDEINRHSRSVIPELEKRGIDYRNNPEAAAEFMTTTIPPNTGYGRYGLKPNENAIYTSNSLGTAEGYTYGKGYIAYVKRPTDFSSDKRTDWIKDNDFNVQKGFKDSKLNEGIVKSDYLKRFPILPRDYVNSGLAGSSPNKMKELEDRTNKRLSDADDLAWKANRKNREERGKIMDLEVSGKISKEEAEKKLRRLWKKDEFINDYYYNLAQLKIYKDIYSDRDLQKNFIKNTFGRRLDPYSHYVIKGNPGEKVLDLVKLKEVTPEIWSNRSRGHYGLSSDKLTRKEQGGLTFNNNKNYYNNNNNNSMRTSYFRDIAESMAKDGTLDRMANGSYAKPRTYGNTYYSDMARYFQDSGSPSMEVARRPSQQEFLEMIYDTLPAAWRQMSPQQAWNTFQQLPIPDQNTFARNAGIQWTDIPTMGMGTEGGDRRPGAVSKPQMIREQGLPTSIYQTLQRLRDLPVKADGTFVTEEEFYSMPVEDQKNWVDQAAARSQERVRNFDTENVVYERRTPTTSGYNIAAPGMEQEIPPSQTPPSPARKKPGKGTGKGKGGRPKPGTSTQGRKTVTPATEERMRGISTKELYGTPPKRVLGGPNTIMDFFGNARGGMQYPPRMQDGQLMYYNDIDKAGIGDFFKGVGRTISDFGRGWADSLGNITGLYDLSNEKYKTKFGKKFSGKADKWMRGIGSVGRMAADVFLPGSGTALGMLGSAINPQGLGSKQQQRDLARQQMAMGASGMAGPNWASNAANAMGQTSQYNPSGMENAMSAMMPGLSALLPSLLGGAMSPGGFAGGPAGQGQGVFRQGGMPIGLMRHMEFMQLFEEPDNSRGTRPYLVY